MPCLAAPPAAAQARLRSNAESVAFYRGIAREGELVHSSFRDVIQHQARVLGKQWHFGMVQVRAPRAFTTKQGWAACSLCQQWAWHTVCTAGCVFLGPLLCAPVGLPAIISSPHSVWPCPLLQTPPLTLQDFLLKYLGATGEGAGMRRSHGACNPCLALCMLLRPFQLALPTLQSRCTSSSALSSRVTCAPKTRCRAVRR